MSLPAARKFQVGDFTVVRIRETELLDFAPEAIFPQWDPASLRSESGGSDAGVFDLAGRNLIPNR